MKERVYKTGENIAQKLGLPIDVVLDIPKIMITGDEEITIENHKGIVTFGEEEIKLRSNSGTISLKGRGLEILFIGGSTIILGGKFKGVNYEGNEI